MWLMSSHKNNHICLGELLFITFQRRDDQKEEEEKNCLCKYKCPLTGSFQLDLFGI